MSLIHLRSKFRKKLPAIYDQETGLYEGWYFDLRLEEELARAARYGLPLSLLVIYISGAEDAPRRSLLSDVLSDVAARRLRRMDIPALLREGGELAVLLPHTPAEHAELVATRLARLFSAFIVATGVASWPDDGDSPTDLLIAAQHRAIASSANPSGFINVIKSKKLSEKLR